MTTCSDCGRPYASNGCGTCHRSKSGAWPISAAVMGTGRGGPGLGRSSPAGRRYQISVKVDERLAVKLRATAIDRGQALGALVRDLIEDGYRHRRGASARAEPTAEHLARRAAFSKPGDGSGILAADRPMRAVMPTVAGGGRFDDR